ncbi:cytochrome b5 reductase 4-like isoform X1 [Mytilus trossulus]|uniref:cytochrome b5 reductase 4-like isoform X1 n=2 Tax=Mytilus trossulus TaxID=6551 RepID=UPI0030052B85
MGCTSSSIASEKKQSPSHSSNSSVDFKMAGQNLLPAFPAANSPQRLQSTGRAKVALKPGRSLMDWIRLGRSNQDLNGFKGSTMDISVEELTKHNKQEDAWIAIRGKVYNVTPYMEYHPGGIEELMRGAGLDGTQLFDEVHKWVNFESMLEKCYIGKLKVTTPIHKRESTPAQPAQIKNLQQNGPSLAALKPPSGPVPPRFDWFQNKNSVSLVIYTKCKHMRRDCVIIRRLELTLLCILYIEDYNYFVNIELENKIKDNYDVRIQKETGKTEIVFPKETETQWSSIGRFLDQHNTFRNTKDVETTYHSCNIESVSEVSHNCKLLCIHLPPELSMCVPLGHHVHVQHNISGMTIARSYTAVIKSLLPDKQDDRLGSVIYLMIKIYKDGALTPWIGSLAPGDTIDISYPEGTFKEESLRDVTDLVMYAAGTGFTPMIRLIYHCLHVDQKPSRNIKLMFFNKTEKDILWKDQLDSLMQDFKNFTVEYVLSEANDNWQGQKGRVTKEIMETFTPASTKDSSNLLICACGPTAFTEIVSQYSKELGYKDDSFHAFLG